jgi:transposase
LINWQSQSQTEQSIKARLARRGRKNVLNIDQRRLLAGCILWFRSNLLPIQTNDNIITIVEKMFGLKIDRYLVYRLCGEFGFSRQKSRRMNPKQVDPSIVEEYITFLKELRNEGWKSNQICLMDEKSI